MTYLRDAVDAVWQGARIGIALILGYLGLVWAWYYLDQWF